MKLAHLVVMLVLGAATVQAETVRHFRTVRLFPLPTAEITRLYSMALLQGRTEHQLSAGLQREYFDFIPECDQEIPAPEPGSFRLIGDGRDGRYLIEQPETGYSITLWYDQRHVRIVKKVIKMHSRVVDVILYQYHGALLASVDSTIHGTRFYLPPESRLETVWRTILRWLENW